MMLRNFTKTKCINGAACCQYIANGNEIKRMSLVSREDLIKAVGLDKIGFLKKPVASTMMNIVQINKLNKLYDKLKDKEGKDFLNLI